MGQLPRIRRPHLTNMYVSQYRGIKLISLPCTTSWPVSQNYDSKDFQCRLLQPYLVFIPIHAHGVVSCPFLPTTCHANNDECTSVHSFYLKPSWITSSSIQPTQPASQLIQSIPEESKKKSGPPLPSLRSFSKSAMRFLSPVSWFNIHPSIHIISRFV